MGSQTLAIAINHHNIIKEGMKMRNQKKKTTVERSEFSK